MKDIKGLTISKELKKEIKKYQDLYFIALAEYETIKEIDKENRIKILKENIFTDDNSKRVLEYDWLIAENQYNNFLEILFEENKKAGLPVDEVGEVADWKAHKKVIEIEKKLFQLQLETVPDYLKKDIELVQNSYKHRQKALDLILKLAV